MRKIKFLSLLAIFMLTCTTMLFAATKPNSYAGKVKVSMNSTPAFEGDLTIIVEHVETGKAKVTLIGEYLGNKINSSTSVAAKKSGKKYIFSGELKFDMQGMKMIATISGTETNGTLTASLKTVIPIQIDAAFNGKLKK